ncbi:DUF6476 family protein [Alphaproteobacteria bacterium]|nr:DUF6476 family protein [Alphaproteobacteria bacterium]
MAGKLDQTEAKLNTGDSLGLKVLKTLVVVMGVLIIAGVITIVVTIVSRISDKANKQGVKTTVGIVASADLVPFSDIIQALPAGGRVVSVSADIGRLYVHYETPDGGARVLVLDSATGGKLGEISFKSAR